MKLKQVWMISLLAIAAMFSLSAWAWVHLPAGSSVPVHFDASGVADRYTGKRGLLEVPLISFGLALILLTIPKIEPLQKNLRRSGKAYAAFVIATILFLSVVHAAIVFSALGWAVKINALMNASLGLLFIVIGNYCGKIRRNFFFGIRTPWTLFSDLSWHRTHRVGGWIILLHGIAFLVTGLLGNESAVVPAVLGGSLVFFSLIALPAYSYLVWRDDQNSSTS